MNSFLRDNAARLAEFAKLSTTVGARSDYVQGGGGNTSVKLNDKLMAIKASGYCLSDIRPDKAYAVLDYQTLRDFYYSHEPGDFENVEKSGSAVTKEAVITIEGMDSLRPSVEAGFHSLLDTYVLHSHSVYANLAACAVEARDILASALEGLDISFGFVPYTDPGATLTFSIRDEIARVQAETGKCPAVILMQNHGIIVHGDDACECVKLHDRVNELIAEQFSLKNGDFPKPGLRESDELYISNAPYLEERLKSGDYVITDFTDDALYPDQIVFLKDTFFMDGRTAIADTCTFDVSTGKITFNMPYAKALAIVQTLAAVVFIRERIASSPYTLSTMGEAAKAFIANWESEKYRKSLAGKK